MASFQGMIPPESSNPSLCRADQDIIDYYADFLQPLLEVFTVRIEYKDQNPGGLYGTIAVGDGWERHYIYNREKQNYESIMPGKDNALLLTTAQPLPASDPIVIKLTLFDKDTDEAIVDGRVVCDPIDHFVEYNKLYSEPVVRHYDMCDKYGEVKVEYALLGQAVVARVEVQLLKCSSAENVVRGLITAPSANFRNCETLLFRKELELVENIKVGPGELIPLSKSVVSVKLGSSLRVFASLYGSDSKEIAHGIAEFPAEMSGGSESVIPGKHGMICVKVTWEFYDGL